MVIKEFVQILHEKSIIMDTQLDNSKTSFHLWSGYHPPPLSSRDNAFDIYLSISKCPEGS
jgi:hypothetical protein